jgi:hypothetical protein
MKRLLATGCAALLCAGCDILYVVEALKPQSAKDAEEKQAFMESCKSTSRMFFSEKVSKQYCECSYGKWKKEGMSAMDAGTACSKTYLETTNP